MVSTENLKFQSAEEVLATIGEPTRQAFLGQLKHEGIAFSAEKVDLAGMESKLRQFFGIGSSIIIEKIYDLFVEKAIQSGWLSPMVSSNFEDGPNAMEAILHRKESQERKST